MDENSVPQSFALASSEKKCSNRVHIIQYTALTVKNLNFTTNTKKLYTWKSEYYEVLQSDK